MYYPLLFRCAVPSAPPDVNKDWTHGAVHSHTLTLQSSTSHLQSFTTFTPLLLLRAPPLFSSPSLDINLWLSTCHLHYYAGLVQQSRALFMDFCCRTGFPAGALALLVCFFFCKLAKPPEKSCNCVRVERALSWTCPVLCVSSRLQLCDKVFLSRIEALGAEKQEHSP